MSSEPSQTHGVEYEQQHVHEVYESIASHFSSTRYKPWPIVDRFLRVLPVGAVGLDIGCGNGKYLTVNPNIFIVGSDRSYNLTSIARQHQPHEALVGDTLSLPHPSHAFDFAISIAVIHHLSTAERRIAATRAILETLRPASEVAGSGAGKALIFVWALEQKDSRRGWDVGDDQDVMVPWVLKTKRQSPKNEVPQDQGQGERVFHRYYHLYHAGELENNIQAAGGTVLEAGYEKDNWWAIATLRADALLPPWEPVSKDLLGDSLPKPI